ADFMKMPFSENSSDAVHAIEATCHAPDAVGCYKEIYGVLQPGQLFAAYEWCMTDVLYESKILLRIHHFPGTCHWVQVISLSAVSVSQPSDALLQRIWYASKIREKITELTGSN
ncbi:hypothetical protein R6Q57_014707, partial [Mikania cordata]